MKVITLLKIVLGLCSIVETRNCLCGVYQWMLHNKEYQYCRQNSFSLRMSSFLFLFCLLLEGLVLLQIVRYLRKNSYFPSIFSMLSPTDMIRFMSRTK